MQSQGEIFHESMLEDYVRVDEYEKGMDYVRKDMQLEIMAQCREMIEEISTTIVAHAVEESQVKMVTLLQTQLADATDKMAGLVNTRTEAVQKALDRINNVALPDQRRHVDEALKAAADGVEAARRELELQCKTQIDIFGERIEAFEIGGSATQMKFRRLASDMDLFRKSLQDSTAKVEDMTNIMRAEQQAQTKIISTLVELEFIQQSLDF